jgi:hypothetical protein
MKYFIILKVMNLTLNLTRPILPTLIALAVIVPNVIPAGAQTVIVSNLAEPSMNLNAGPVGSDRWLAQGFSTPAGTSYSLDSVSLRLYVAAPFQGTYTVSFWDSSGPAGRPGSQLAAISSGNQVSSLTTSPADYAFPASGAGITLAPSTSYFVVLSASVQYALSGLYWSFPDSATPGSTGPGQMGEFTESANQGATWDFLSSGPPYQIEVSGTAVPEPEMYALVSGLALVGFAAFRRLRRKDA